MRTRRVRADSGLRLRGRELRPHGLIFTSADGKNRPWVKSHPRGKRGRAWVSGR
jgi:hypothetical protein